MDIDALEKHLNALPDGDPRTRQYLQAAVNGQNPNVPQWLALVRLQEFDRVEQAKTAAQNGQQGPLPTVKDRVEQSAGLMSLQQGRQQAAMQQMMQQASRQPGGPAMAQAPQQQAGIAAVAPRPFRHGGMVRGFNEGGGIYDVLGEYGPLIEERMRREKEAREAAAKQRELARQMAAQEVAVPEDPNVIQEREYARMGIDPRRAYEQQGQRIADLQARMQEDEATRARERATMGKQGFFNSLIAAREATRGARGSGIAAALSGYGAAQGAANQGSIDERRNSDALLMRRQAELDALMGDLDKSRMGTAEQYGKRGYEHSGKVAEGKNVRAGRMFDVEKNIMKETGDEADALGRSTGDIIGRSVSAHGTNKTAVNYRLRDIDNGIKAVDSRARILVNQRKNAVTEAVTPDVRDRNLQNIDSELADLKGQREAYVRERNLLMQQMNGGGQPAGGGSGITPGAGGTGVTPRVGSSIPAVKDAYSDWRKKSGLE